MLRVKEIWPRFAFLKKAMLQITASEPKTNDNQTGTETEWQLNHKLIELNHNQIANKPQLNGSWTTAKPQSNRNFTEMKSQLNRNQTETDLQPNRNFTAI